MPKGQISLYGAAVIFVGPPKVNRAHAVEVSTPSRSLFLAAQNAQEQKEWAIAIQKAAILHTGVKSKKPAAAAASASPTASATASAASSTAAPAESKDASSPRRHEDAQVCALLVYLTKRSSGCLSL